MPENILIKRYDGSAWVNILPKTSAENIISGTFVPARIPNLDTSKITTGTFVPDRIPDLDTSKITTGTFVPDRIPDLDASKITTGVLDVGILPAIAITNITTYTTMSSFITLYSGNPGSMQEGDILILTTDNETHIHNGGSTGTASDFTKLSVPTANVASVAGKTGVVTLVKADVGLGSVDNTSDTNKPVSTAQQTALNLKANKVTITANTRTKITYNSQGIVTAGDVLAASDIPDLDASKITTGVLDVGILPAIAQSKISGLVSDLAAKQTLIPVVNETVLAAMVPNTGDIAFVT